MDRKQPLLLILVITIFGIAIAGAIWVFGRQNIQLRRDSMFADINRIAADAHAYRLRPAPLGGGGGSYARFSIPERLRSNDIAAYAVSPLSSGDTLLITATAKGNLGTITAGVDRDGKVTITLLTGDLAY